MAGKECVAIASDLRFGVQLQTLATDYKKVGLVGRRLACGAGQTPAVALHALAGCRLMFPSCPAAPAHRGLTKSIIMCLPPQQKQVYKIHDQLFLGLAGLGSDAETL